MLKEGPTKLEAKISVNTIDIVKDVIDKIGINPNSTDYIPLYNKLMQIVEEKIIPQGNQAWYQGMVLCLKDEYGRKLKGNKKCQLIQETH